MHGYLYLEVLDGMVAEGSSGILDTHHLSKMQIFGESVVVVIVCRNSYDYLFPVVAKLSLSLSSPNNASLVHSQYSWSSVMVAACGGMVGVLLCV